MQAVDLPVVTAEAAPVTALRAEIRGEKAIWVREVGGKRLDPALWQLTDAKGGVIPITAVLPQQADTVLIVPKQPINIRRVYYVALPADKLRVRARFDGWFRTLYSDKPLGANVAPDHKSTTFRVFAPRATAVSLYLYDKPDEKPNSLMEPLALVRDENGVFEVTLPGDLKGKYYDFTVHGPDDPGNQFYEQAPVHVSDPYARVQVEEYNKSRVWYPEKPATPLKAGRPKMEDVVAYELHVRDFTNRLPVKAAIKGRIPAMTVKGLTNSHGQPIGFDYLTRLGINVVHLMPMQQFMSYPTKEWRAIFHNDPDMKAVGINDENYQWGYSTTHAFAIEGRYRARNAEPGAERDEFRDLIQAFHDHGIAVVVDIVPNHTGENMRGGKLPVNLNAFGHYYYYRTDDEGREIGPYGNEVKTEDRPMVQRWLIDQAKMLVDEFGVDGFRIDLAGQLDRQTLLKLRQAVGPDVLIYGEPWIPVSDPYVKANKSWHWYKENAPITFFQDDARNAFKGSPFVLKNKRTDRGYAGGNASLRDAAMKGLSNDLVGEEKTANGGINYLDIHDNWALADRFALHDWDGRKGVDVGPYRIAATLLLTSQGPVVMQGGTEMMRSKGAATLHGVAKQTKEFGEVRLKGRDDTYNQRIPNEFVWENVGVTKGPNNYKAMEAFWHGLIALRMSDWGTVFRHAVKTPGWYQWITPKDKALLGYVTGSRVMVLMNVGDTKGVFSDVTPPAGNWRLVSVDGKVDLKGLTGEGAHLTGGQAHTLTVPATGVKIWVRE
ncbi:alpha-amylase family glycosyl hydrolase [Kordiimonas marina]|uniref:alpha-amylase family glycosyl hydrolase n=1 Tax=Kordiimonas marina TaxID=2872312 RepID=UPI0031B9DA11